MRWTKFKIGSVVLNTKIIFKNVKISSIRKLSVKKKPGGPRWARILSDGLWELCVEDSGGRRAYGQYQFLLDRLITLKALYTRTFLVCSIYTRNCNLVAYDHSIISLPIIFDEQNKKYVIKNNDKKTSEL